MSVEGATHGSRECVPTGAACFWPHLPVAPKIFFSIRGTQSGQNGRAERRTPTLRWPLPRPGSRSTPSSSTTKSYSSRVVAEFNSRGIIAIVAPNGAGKSCLVEGICFALGLDLRSMRAQNLKALVNRTGRDDGVACAVSCVFRARSGAGALCVQRRAIAPADGPARSEFRVQGCSCGGLGPGVEHDQLPWPCDQCEVRVARRSELKALLLRELQLDVDRPDTFVVQQSACASIAQQTPLELLCFIEDFARTAHLRRGVEADLFPPRFRDSAWQTHTASLPVSLLPIHRLCSFKIL